MRTFIDTNGNFYYMFTPKEKEACIEVSLFLHDLGYLSLSQVQINVQTIKYGSVLPKNVVFLPKKE